MKKMIIGCLTLIALAATFQSAIPKDDDDVMTKEGDTYVVNTTKLGKDVQGYASTAPVKIYIKKNKVEKVEFLKNQETPKYMARVKKAMLNKWDGLKVKDAAKQKVDGVTGATFSSDAIIKNVQLGLEHYQSHK
jgi:electron transport complex protein RnfG